MPVAKSANDTAGEYLTPRNLVRLTTTLVFPADQEVLKGARPLLSKRHESA
ncbi:hypothetical protein [Candidatus Thiosymbion oneisti]|uniref:hypothetical protein n=1 Tax=Candidatus Thiosymbion oneisti TaxID=589554 RepID=UPI00159F0760|nr:hypothetical protein [Candidatus Thiosymbion oneisti]